MYFTKIRLNGVSDVDLPIIGASPADTFILKGVDGLGPVEIVVTVNNGVYQGSEPQDRQLVMRVGLNANYGINQTPEQLRTTLYGLLAPGWNTPLRIELLNASTIVGFMTGYIAKIEPVIFSKDPEVQITIDCIGSYIYSPNTITTVPALKTGFTVNNPGSAPVGAVFTVLFTSTTPAWALRRTSNPNEFFEVSCGFNPGDKLVIDTCLGERRVEQVIDDSTINNLIGYVNPDSVWMQMLPGDNTLDTTSTFFNWVGVDIIPQYWGV